MERGRGDPPVPGVVVVVVQGGRTIFSKGYGGVDPERTRFYLGSLSKPVTAAAILGLVEQGRLDLHADVNRYLKRVSVPEGSMLRSRRPIC